MRRFSAFVLLTIACMAPATGAQAARCYNSDLVNAEQLVRLHSELMVIMLTCRQGSDGSNLIKAYQSFTQKNISAIKDAERTLITYFREQGGSGEAKMDKMRTRYANNYSQQAADASLPTYCSLWSDRVVQATRWSSAQLQGEIRTFAARYPTEQPACDVPRSTRAEKERDDVRAAEAAARRGEPHEEAVADATPVVAKSVSSGPISAPKPRQNFGHR